MLLQEVSPRPCPALLHGPFEGRAGGHYNWRVGMCKARGGGVPQPQQGAQLQGVNAPPLWGQQQSSELPVGQRLRPPQANHIAQLLVAQAMAVAQFAAQPAPPEL